MAHKYSNFLTVLLVIVIIAIIIGIGFLIYNFAFSGNEDEAKDNVIAKWDENMPQEPQGGEENPGGDVNIISPGEAEGGGNSSSGRKKIYYEDFVMVGYIEIPATGIKYPILEQGTDKSLEVSVAVMYPENAVLNTVGNVVIMGHNFRNGKFFSDNKKLSTGDTIKIAGYSNTVTYKIYEIFEVTPNETSFMTRDTKGKREITLYSCTDDGTKRLIIKARAD